jgi:hypothetical protein
LSRSSQDLEERSPTETRQTLLSSLICVVQLRLKIDNIFLVLCECVELREYSIVVDSHSCAICLRTLICYPSTCCSSYHYKLQIKDTKTPFSYIGRLRIRTYYRVCTQLIDHRGYFNVRRSSDPSGTDTKAADYVDSTLIPLG